MNCPSCGAEAPVGARFCPSCGHELVVRGDERRVVTVVFGDIVGFTAMCETLDPERVKILVDDVFDRLAADIVSFGGQVDKVVGDGIVALFGAPVAHEDDAERAVRAALKMQETVQALEREVELPIRMRIGVNTGEALVGAVRAAGDYTATGDAVNTASRLQSAAAPGGVLVGPGTHQATLSVIRYERVEPVMAKGKEEPVRAWRAVEPLGRPGEHRSRLQTALVGRDLELVTLRRALEVSVLRRRSQLLLVMGEAGVGKSRLAQELAEAARREHDATVLAGRCVPYGEANIWFPIAEAFRGMLRIEPELPPDHARARLVDEIAGLFRLSPNAPEVERAVVGILQLLDYDTPLRELDAQTATTEIGRAVRAYLHARAARGPVVLWLADLHWADDIILRMVDGLVQRLARVPFVVLGTARYALNERWSPQATLHNVVVISLDPLDRSASEQLLGLLLPDSSPELQTELLDRAGGNPFFLQELVALVGDGSRASIVHAELPSSVRGLVSARLDGLPDVERAVLEDAAVLGRRGSIPALARMAIELHGPADIPEIVRRLRDQDLLVIDRDEWTFRSDLIRDIAYSRLTKTERARRHAGIAEFLVQQGEGARVDTIAYHYRRAAELALELGGVPGLPADLRGLAAEWLVKAASGASGRVARDVAARLYGQALALLTPDDRRRPTLLLARAKALLDGHELPAARRDVTEARALAPDNAYVAALAAMRTGEIEQKSGDYERAVVSLDDAIARFRRIDDTGDMAEALRLAGMTHLFSGRNDEAEASISAALQAFQDVGNVSGEAWSHQNLAWISFVRGRVTQAERRVAQALEQFELAGDESGLSWCQGLLAYVRLHQGRFDEADALSAKAYADSRERGERWGEGMMVVLRASVHLWSGRTEAAVRRAEEAVEIFSQLRDPLGELQALAVLGRALVLVGRVDDGFQVFADTATRQSSPSNREGVFLLVSTAAAAAATTVGDPDEALRWAPLHDIGRFDPALTGHGERLVAVGLALAQQGDVERGRSVLEIAARPDPDLGPNPNALAGLALANAALGHHERARELARAVDQSSRVTYADSAMASVAEALVAAHRGDAAAVAEALATARAVVVRTQDRIHRAIVALAESVAVPTPEARGAAHEQLAALGIDAVGWRSLFERIAAAELV